MIPLESIKGFFPEELRGPQFARHLLKEYVECLALEWIARSAWASQLTFIGGTNLRLIKGIDRFSEDLDFDCKNLTEDDFRAFTDGLVAYLVNNGLPAVAKERESDKLTAFRRSILFPGLLQDIGLSAFKEERFMMKVEAQDQGVTYRRNTVSVARCGFFFPVAVPPDEILCAMKLSALLTRAKGRDFYDAMFLLQRTMPDYAFFSLAHPEIVDFHSLKLALATKAKAVNLSVKCKDVEHLLFRHDRAEMILHFADFVSMMNG